MHALGLEFGSAAQLSKRPGSVLNCLWGNTLKRSPGIIRKSRVSYPGPGFLSSATWPSLPKKHYNGLTLWSVHIKKSSSFSRFILGLLLLTTYLDLIMQNMHCIILPYISISYDAAEGGARVAQR